ncbi:class I SAM-dependent methyltransferase [Mycolicibacterium austroafricanum]|uniref:S-adenosyl-L-methionine-dependent methyltransferase n=1 Tax=Mycolicibacterium austroafricanum TaxID=39687 RepID=A0ABT8HPR7_MYCAO|nr:class I SAM-dependent methyltransferase [Mycolicibacterium austroafricanum]MDN4522765.1 class I SAM-dependent methyltransferase [Mycolicibacterium austroafricanum]QRZ06887.1 class I SAM-dependent methyltransferase [Mycolicibacterium austroafricanum]QZT68369.1 class I SAM-dependent methyltransferase [Mycolicibacterium austroafricanum]
MEEPATPVSNVSDTARWVAVYRAIESARADAVFDDPFADRLAGERGREIVATVPRMMRSGWWMVARTKTIDDILMDAIGAGCDRVLNLAAGLDTRPYRLPLPAEFSWVEADLPALVAEKEQLLAGESPRCRLTRHPVDLSDPVARDRFLDEALSGAVKALVLTEGLLMYLDPSDVDDLSRALVRPEVAWWMLDLAGPGLKKWMNDNTGGLLRNAPFKFAPADGVGYFEQLGWRTCEIESVFVVARRLRRLPWLLRLVAWLPQPDPHRPPADRPWSAVVRLTR